MEWVETTGRTVDEAKDAALDQLGVDEADAEFVVVEEPKAGLFGRLRSEARVRARVQPTRPRPKDDRRDRKRRSRGKAEQPATASSSSAPADNGERVEEEDHMEEPEVPLEEQGERAREFVAGVMERFGLPSVTVETRPVDDETIEVVAHGNDLGLLIGPKGATLGALQDLARTVVQRQTGARTGRLLVDVAGYRERRREALERFTRQVAEEVVASGTTKVLEPMAPADRKVVHDTATQIPGVTSLSEGEEPRRRVVLSPEHAP